MAQWHDVESARDQWIDAPLDDDVLEELLGLAREQVIAYAPVPPADPDEESGAEPAVPASWRYYQLQQARNIWNASKVDAASGGAGSDEFVIRPHPLDWTIKQGLRPRKGVPRVR